MMRNEYIRDVKIMIENISFVINKLNENGIKQSFIRPKNNNPQRETFSQDEILPDDFKNINICNKLQHKKLDFSFEM